jgi:hypothetical protein
MKMLRFTIFSWNFRGPWKGLIRKTRRINPEDGGSISVIDRQPAATEVQPDDTHPAEAKEK